MKSILIFCKNSFIFWVFNIILFLYIFQPALPIIKLPHNLDYVFIGYLIVLFFIGKKIDISWIRKFYGFIPFAIYIIIYFLFLYITDPFKFTGLTHSYISLLMTLMHLGASITFLLTLAKNHFSKENILKAIKYVLIIQFIFVVLAFAFQPVKFFFDSLTFLYSNDEVTKEALRNTSMRAYGFADNLFDIFGVRLALLTVLLFIIGLDKNKKAYVFLSFVFLFMSLVNARTGVLLSLLGFSISLFIYLPKFSIKRIINSIILLLILLSSIITAAFCFLPSNLLMWLQKGGESTISLVLEGKREGVYREILGNDLNFIPSNIWLGEGVRPRDVGDNTIDNGYMQELWLFGLIGIILYFGGVLIFFWNVYKSTKYQSAKCVSICYFIIYLLYNIKLFPLFFSSVNFLLYGIPLLLSLPETTMTDLQTSNG